MIVVYRQLYEGEINHLSVVNFSNKMSGHRIYYIRVNLSDGKDSLVVFVDIE